ncbi:hypothetical protein [Scleromatobacter humisilvae]|uniref:Uncharacterized protein n=1 Tax=Scleromatobacter humisilvae TaxID=2897159 RepID=A0A9X1YFA5_9BURK|nr:hypothetical protein [Scleromatobacter humisilvae]MCK9684405.1 hypothetical protein [Scleromatobacter humisilvae]
MSLELVVVFALAMPPSAESLQSALDRKGVPIRLSQSGDLQKRAGFLPLMYEMKPTGFFVAQLTYKELTTDYPQARVPSGAAKSVISLGFGGHFLECASVFRVASVLVSEFGARAFGTESGNYISLEDIDNTAAACDAESKKE